MTKRARRDYFIVAPDDGLPAHEVGPWAEQKYRYVGMYAEMFATGMKRKVNRRVYLDLFSGPGHSVVRDTGRRVLGSPLLSLALPDPFDAYIFADASAESVDALQARVAGEPYGSRASVILGDANERVAEIVKQVPGPGGERTLSFCFLDPFKLNIHFETVRQLAEGRAIDFLILLALYVDANRNISTYVRDESRTIDQFLGDREWREEWRKAQAGRGSVVEFLAHAYSERMARIGYLPMRLDEMVKIRSYDRQLPLYYLAFYTRHKTGLRFWREVLRYATDQLSLL